MPAPICHSTVERDPRGQASFSPRRGDERKRAAYAITRAPGASSRDRTTRGALELVPEPGELPLGESTRGVNRAPRSHRERALAGEMRAEFAVPGPRRLGSAARIRPRRVPALIEKAPREHAVQRAAMRRSSSAFGPRDHDDAGVIARWADVETGAHLAGRAARRAGDLEGAHHAKRVGGMSRAALAGSTR